MAKQYIFNGVLCRHEDGSVVVEAESPDEAKHLLAEGDWTEWSSLGGNTDFEWDGREPRET